MPQFPSKGRYAGGDLSISGKTLAVQNLGLVFGNVYTPVVTGRILGMLWYMASASGGSEQFVGNVYTAPGGSPVGGISAAGTGAFTISSTTPAWYWFPIPGAFNLMAGTSYLLGLNSFGGTANAAGPFADTSAGKLLNYTGNYGSGVGGASPGTWPASSSSALGQWAMVALIGGLPDPPRPVSVMRASVM